MTAECEEFTHTFTTAVDLSPHISCSFADEHLGAILVENHFAVPVSALGERINHIIKGFVAADGVPDNEFHFLL